MYRLYKLDKSYELSDLDYSDFHLSEEDDLENWNRYGTIYLDSDMWIGNQGDFLKAGCLNGNPFILPRIIQYVSDSEERKDDFSEVYTGDRVVQSDADRVAVFAPSMVVFRGRGTVAAASAPRRKLATRTCCRKQMDTD